MSANAANKQTANKRATNRPAAGSTLTITPPADFALPRDVCSYGYFLLAPNHWDPATQTLRRILHLATGPAACVISQKPQASNAAPASKLTLRFDRPLDPAERTEAKAQITRMLRLDESAEAIADFHNTDPRWADRGRGRLFRSPTLFEDVVKTVTSCNVAWPSTIKMNLRLCEVLGQPAPSGGHAFPTARKLARTRVGTLRARCGVGYRDQRLVALAKHFVKGDIDEARLTDPATDDDTVFKFLITLPGIGPYAAGNIMQLLGRYSRLALDTESVRHGKAVLGYKGEDRAILKKLTAHYEAFGDHKFRSYWFELWDYYESKRGRAEDWDRETTGRTFTAAHLDNTPGRKKQRKKKRP